MDRRRICAGRLGAAFQARVVLCSWWIPQPHATATPSSARSENRFGRALQRKLHTVVLQPPSTTDTDSGLSICYLEDLLTINLDESAVIQSGASPQLSPACGQFATTATFNWSASKPVDGTAPDPNSAR